MTGVGSSLTPDERAAVRLVIDLVDLLAARHGFDATELVNPRPPARDLPRVTLRDIDEVQDIAAANREGRRQALPDAWSIVRAECRGHPGRPSAAARAG